MFLCGGNNYTQRVTYYNLFNFNEVTKAFSRFKEKAFLF